jgi:hypothetical protein
LEREVIGERVRDKIAASKRIWVGGPVPLGYRSVDKKLEIVPEEADLVRKIFEGYLRLGSISALATSLNAEGMRPKPRRWADGRRPGPFIVAAIGSTVRSALPFTGNSSLPVEQATFTAPPQPRGPPRSCRRRATHWP